MKVVGSWIDIPTAVGTYHAMITAVGIRRLLFPGRQMREDQVAQDRSGRLDHASLNLRALIRRELAAYHAGELREFSIPLDLAGHTAFRVKVWRTLVRIPFGTRATYGEIAGQVGCASARAVGRACGANPIPVIVPCHRVVTAGGGLGGWSGPVGMKRKLLAWESGG